MVYYDNDLCLVKPDADHCFDLVEDELSKILPDTPKGVHRLSVTEFVKDQRADFLFDRLTAAVGEQGTQFDSDKSRILL